MKISPFNPDWTEPDWPAPPNVRALCTARQGGCSAGPYDSFNLGDHVGDDPGAVSANRQRLQDGIAAMTSGAHPVFLQQVHGTDVVLLDGNEGTGSADRQQRCADASMASAAGKVCTILVADCLPVLLTNRQGSVVAAVHAGWRGLAGLAISADTSARVEKKAAVAGSKGVLESTLGSFWALAQAQHAPAAIKNEAAQAEGLRASLAADTLAWLGPCIGPEAFEVGEEVRAAFCEHNAAAARHFRPSGAGKYLADLAALARQRLRAAGVTQIQGNDSSAPWCTVSHPSRFFSHRRDSASLGASGRFAVCIWRV